MFREISNHQTLNHASKSIKLAVSKPSYKSNYLDMKNCNISNDLEDKGIETTFPVFPCTKQENDSHRLHPIC